MRPTRLLPAACALALSVVALPAAASPTPAPTVRESFTPLPCPSRPRTTRQIEGCAEHRVLATDRTIDALNTKVVRKLRPAARAGFVSSNAAWVSYRDEACAAAASPYTGGSLQPVAYANCLVAIDRSHVGELRGLLVALPAG